MIVKFKKLWSYVYDRNYNIQLYNSCKYRLYDYSIILIWKIFMLFLYEKIYQIPENKILKAWKNRFKKDKPRGFKKDNLYWPNEHDDKDIIGLFYELYNIDNNVLKNAKALSQKRDTAAHVSDIHFTLNDADNFLDDILKLCEKFQRCHNNELKLIDINSLDQAFISKRFSKKDMVFLLARLIEVFGKSSSFGESTLLRNKIIALKNYLSRDNIKDILGAIKKNSVGAAYHQILEASGTDMFIKNIYLVYNEPSPEWNNFAKFLIKCLKNYKVEHYLPNYNWLFEIFSMKKFENKSPNVDDILF
jgi:hypothetical protein